MKTDNTQAYIEADQKHKALTHQACMEYIAAREAWNKCAPEDNAKHIELCNKAANKMKAAKAAHTKALNKILKAG
jgi:hypothetical protein